MDSLLSEEVSIHDWLNIMLRSPLSAEQDLSSLGIKLQLIEQDLELNLDYQSYSALSIMQSLNSEAELIYKQTLELINEAQREENLLKGILTPEVAQLQKDHHVLAAINQSKGLLKEIEQIEAKVEKVQILIQEDLYQATHLLKNLHSCYEAIKEIPHYKEKTLRIVEVVEEFDKTLAINLVEAAEKSDSDTLKLIYIGFAAISRVEKFDELFFATRFEALPSTLDGDLLEKFSTVKALLKHEILFFQEVFDDSTVILNTFISSYLEKHNLLLEIEGINIETMGLFYEDFVDFAKFVKEHCGDVSCIENYLFFCDKVLEIEKKTLEDLEKTTTRPISLESWTRESLCLLKALEKSWEQSMSLTFGTCGYNWAQLAESIFTARLRYLSENYSEITHFPIETIPQLDKPDANFKFKWDFSNKFVKIYESILNIFTLLENLSERCRNSFLQRMTTSYFSSQWEIQKDLQSLIFKNDGKLLKNSVNLVGFLREGGVLFTKSLELMEKELELCRSFTERVLMSGVSMKLEEYCDLPIWTSTDTVFSVSPSSHILYCGEHLLAILQLLSTSPVENYLKAFQITYSIKPPSDLPHSMASHFWIMNFGVKFFKSFSGKIGKIKEISSEGKKHLLADIEYILNISQALGMFKQEDMSLGCGISSLRDKLRDRETDISIIRSSLSK